MVESCCRSFFYLINPIIVLILIIISTILILINLLVGVYLNSRVYVRSTNIDRTLLSAYSNLAGMFPSSQSEIGESVFPWQPIPVHSADLDADFVRKL